MSILNCITDLRWLFYNVHETLTVIVSNMYLFYASFAGLGVGLEGLVFFFVLVFVLVLALLVLTTKLSVT